MTLFDALFGPGWVVCLKCRGIVRATHVAENGHEFSACAHCEPRFQAMRRGHVFGALTLCGDGTKAGAVTMCTAAGGLEVKR